MVRRMRSKKYKGHKFGLNRTHKKGGVKFLRKCFPRCFPRSRSNSPTNVPGVPVPVVGGPVQPQPHPLPLPLPPLPIHRPTLADVKKMSPAEINTLPPEIRSSLLTESTDIQKQLIQAKINFNDSLISTRTTTLAKKQQDRADALARLNQKPFWVNHMTNKTPIPPKNKTDFDLKTWTRLGNDIKSLEKEIEKYNKNVTALRVQLDNVGKPKLRKPATVRRVKPSSPPPVSLPEPEQPDFDDMRMSNSSSSDEDYGFGNGAAAVDNSLDLDLDAIRRDYGISSSDSEPGSAEEDDPELEKYRATLQTLQSENDRQAAETNKELQKIQEGMTKVNGILSRPIKSRKSSGLNGGKRKRTRNYKRKH
jgi:hypothetical protein